MVLALGALQITSVALRASPPGMGNAQERSPHHPTDQRRPGGAPTSTPARCWPPRTPTESHAPASTIKILLAMVVLDHLRATQPRISQSEATAKSSAPASDSPPVSRTPTTQLLSALLMVSGNDAANMLARHAWWPARGGRRHERQGASSSALASTRASSPSGLDGPGWETLTTAHDLAVMLRQALRYPLIAQIFRARRRHRSPTRTAGHRQLQAQNELLTQYPGDIRRQDRVHQSRTKDVYRCRATL